LLSAQIRVRRGRRSKDRLATSAASAKKEQSPTLRNASGETLTFAFERVADHSHLKSSAICPSAPAICRRLRLLLRGRRVGPSEVPVTHDRIVEAVPAFILTAVAAHPLHSYCP